MGRIWQVVVGLVLIFTVSVQADENIFNFGGDVFGGNESVNISDDVPNDIFVIGNNITVSGDVGGDVHAVGTNVFVQRNVEGNIYAGGNSVKILGDVGRDILAGGGEISILGNKVAGNVRLMGRDVMLNAFVVGNALIGAKNFTLNNTIAGNLRFNGAHLTFGDNAKVLGRIHIKGPNEIDVPETVASADRITFVQSDAQDASYQVGTAANDLAWRFWPSFLPGFGVLFVAFMVGVIWLALMPDRSTMAYLVSREKPFKSLFIGLLGLSMFLGLILVLGISLFGIPLIPVALVLLILAWVLGYVGGAYFLSMRIIEAFGKPIESLGFQVLALALGLAIAWGLGMIPFIGWLSQLALVFFGLGAKGLAIIYRRSGSAYYGTLHDRFKVK